jgi:hypothetical protein
MVSRISSTTHGPQMATAGKERLQARNRMERVGARWTPLRFCSPAVIPRRLKGRQVRPTQAGGYRGIGSSKTGGGLGLLLSLIAGAALLQPAMSHRSSRRRNATRQALPPRSLSLEPVPDDPALI